MMTTLDGGMHHAQPQKQNAAYIPSYTVTELRALSLTHHTIEIRMTNPTRVATNVKYIVQTTEQQSNYETHTESTIFTFNAILRPACDKM